MFSRKFLLLLSVILVLICAFVADDADIKTITLKLEKFRKNYPQEKVHIHLDKPYYSIGDTIYFKAYVVNAEKNTPSVISNIVYVDLIDDNNKVSETIKLPVTDGIAWGSIIMADSLHEGNYRIRAYTNWMRNFDEAFFFDKVIAVVNGFNSEINAVPSIQLSYTRNKNNDSVSIQYTTTNDVAADGKKISYSVVINDKEEAKGKGVTDNNGRLKISLQDMHAPPGEPVVLLTHIKLDDKTITKEIRITIPSVRYSIRFFPEGGQMVAGVTSRIGFKAMRADGFGTEISGEVTDDSTNETISIKSGFAGIGSFKFTPKPGHTYHALIQYQDSTKESIVMPAAETSGYVLSVNNSNSDSITLNITSKQAAEKLIIIGQINNRIQYSELVDLNEGNTSINLSKKKFPTGIIQFTLFDAALHPVAERLAFINHHDELKLNVSLDKTAYAKREKTSMQLTIKDEKGNPVGGSFSIAVTDANTVLTNKDKEQTMLSGLLLTSDIKGYVEDAGYYFTAINDAKIKAMDDLLLTQGWRRFVWQDVLAGKYPSVDFVKEKSLAISGKIVSSKGIPVNGSHVMLLPKNESAIILDTTTNSTGSFMFDNLSFDDRNPFVLQASKTNDNKEVEIKLTDFSAPAAATNKNKPELQQALTYTLVPYLKHSQQQYDNMRRYGLLQSDHQLKDVVVTTPQQTRIKEAVAPSANLNGPGNADQILTYEDLNNCHDLGNCLQGKITGVFFKMVPEDPRARNVVWHLVPFSASGMGAPMMVVLDGNYITAGLDIRNIPVQNIQSIEVLRSGGYSSVYGFQGSGGVLVITTKKGGIDYNANTLKANNPAKDVVFTIAKGYTVCRQFYMPDYSAPVIKNAPIPDMRSTIFWKPDIVTNDDGIATIEWYNADNAGDCNIVIEGISAEGKIGAATFTYKIK